MRLNSSLNKLTKLTTLKRSDCLEITIKTSLDILFSQHLGGYLPIPSDE